MIGYAVLDTETTGLNKYNSDRVIEIGIVLLDNNLNVEGTLETVLNPHRDVGATHIHHLSGIICDNAPDFEDISETLLAFLSNRIIIAHNAPFDTRFLSRELANLDKDIDFVDNYIDTIKLLNRSRSYRGANNKLETACDFYGIPNNNAHTALSDAMATAKLFERLYRESPVEISSMPGIHPLRIQSIPVSQARGYNWLSRDEINGSLSYMSSLKPHLQNLKATTPVQDSDITVPVVNDYLAQMHRQLLNGSYLMPQTNAITALIAKHQLSKGQVINLHEEYIFMRLCGFYAVNDNKLTDEHERRLRELSSYLEISHDDLNIMAKQTLVESHLIIPKSRELGMYFSLNTGDRVSLTGEEWIEGKDELLLALSNFGITDGMVSSKTKAVISNDPYSLSSKAAKGRSLNIPTLSEKTIIELTGIASTPS